MNGTESLREAADLDVRAGGHAVILSRGADLPVLDSVHQLQATPSRIDCAHLDVDHPGIECVIAHDIFSQIGCDPTGLLRPRDPESAGFGYPTNVSVKPRNVVGTSTSDLAPVIWPQ